MEPIPIQSLLARYTRNLQAPEASVTRTLCEIVEARLGIPLAREQLSYSPHTRVVTIRLSGPHKSELLLHKHELLVGMRDVLPPHAAPHDII
jgi:hypothetical protein